MEFEDTRVTLNWLAEKSLPFEQTTSSVKLTNYQEKVIDKVREKLLDTKLQEYNISNISSQEEATEMITSLYRLELPDLRLIHAISNPYARGEVKGSICLSKNKNETDQTFIAVNNPNYRISVKKAQFIGILDFVPFGELEKKQTIDTNKPQAFTHAKHAIFLSCSDLLRTIHDTQIDSTEAPIIFAESNAIMARLVINRLGFHLYGLSAYDRKNKKIYDSNDQSAYDLLNEYAHGKEFPEGIASIGFQFFIQTEELFSKNTSNTLEKIIKTLTERHIHKKDDIEQKDIDKFEKEIRVNAIVKSILSRYEEETKNSFQK